MAFNQKVKISSPGESRVIYTLKGIDKLYFATKALSDINLEFFDGEIHGLVGKNGAGKSTLVGIMYGSVQPSAGETIILGRKIEKLTPIEAKKLKIFLVPQSPQVIPDLSIAENLFLGNFPLSNGIINKRHMVDEASDLVKKLGLSLSPTMPMRHVSMECQQLIQVGKALWILDSRIIMLDEATASLSFESKERLFTALRNAVATGHKMIVFITHRLEEVMELCDRITVIRDGRKIGTVKKSSINTSELVYMMTGVRTDKDVFTVPQATLKKSKKLSKTLLSVRGLSKKGQFENINLDGVQGEVIGLSGLEGAGVENLMRCLGGVFSPDNGEVLVQGKKIHVNNPWQAIKVGIAYLTRNREEEGIFHNLSVEHNIMESIFSRFTNKFGFIKWPEVHLVIDENIRSLNIKMESPRTSIDSLSGGNKQRVLISRIKNMHPKIFLLDQVTHGIDIETKRDVLKLIRQRLAPSSLIIVSSDSVEELTQVCHRIIVMFKGYIINVFHRPFVESQIHNAIQGMRK